MYASVLSVQAKEFNDRTAFMCSDMHEQRFVLIKVKHTVLPGASNIRNAIIQSCRPNLRRLPRCQPDRFLLNSDPESEL
jgi:hypothetical protein